VDATIANVKTVERATTIGEGSMRVHTVEHVLSALCALEIDNALVEMDANEPPIGDGSALAYVEAIRKAGVVAQEAPRPIFHVREPISVETKNGSLVIVLPDDEFRISCTQAGRTIALRNFFRRRSRPRFTRTKSPLPAPSCITKTSSR